MAQRAGRLEYPSGLSYWSSWHLDVSRNGTDYWCDSEKTRF